MTTPHIIQSIIELLLIIAVIVGGFFEYKIADFEKRLFQKIIKFLEVIQK